jgi:hypothetical protein
MNSADPSIFGLSRDWWSVLSVIGTIVAAIGTMLAVMLSMWLVLRSSRFRGQLKVSIAYPMGAGFPPQMKLLQIQLVSTSDRIVKVTGVGWRVKPWGDKSLLYQFIDPIAGIPQSPIPCVLSPGEDVSWYVNLDEGQWFERVTAEWTKRPRQLFVYAGFADGSRFERAVSEGVLEAFQRGYDLSHFVSEETSMHSDT